VLGELMMFNAFERILTKLRNNISFLRGKTMPTNPIEDLIPRNLPSDIERVLASLSALIEETVNFGTHVLNWCSNSAVSGNEHAPLILSFRHILELLDAISVLLKKSCFEPCKLLLRSIFETLLNMEYLLKEDFVQRGKDFLFWNRIQYRKSLLSMYAFKTEQEKAASDPVLKSKLVSTIEKIKKEIQAVDKSLAHSSCTESRVEFERYKKSMKREPGYWYSLRNGPPNIAVLAEHLNKKERYLILYKEWAQFSHGINIFQGNISRAKDGGTLFTQIRLPRNNGTIVSLAISFGMESMRLMIRKYVKERRREMDEWYFKEIREGYLWVSENDPIKISD
jgi:hypothetical protein